MPHQMGNQIPPEDANITLLADILDNLSSHVETLVKNQDYMVNIQERTADMLERQAIAIERIVTHLKLSPETSGLTDSPHTDPDAKPAFENHYTTSRELDETMEDNLGNSWNEPARTPGVAPLVKPAVRPGAAPVVKKAKEIQPAPRAKKASPQKIDTGKPVLRKRRKIVAKEVIAPKTAKPKVPAPAKEIKASKSPNTPVQPASNQAKLMPRDTVMDIIQSMRKEGATYDQVAKRLVDLGQPTFSGRGEWHAQTIHRLCSKK